MKENSSLTKSQIREWWMNKRKLYTLGLFISGFLAFILSGTLADLLIPEKYFEVNLFTMIFHGLGYLAFIFIANIFYFLGEIIDKSFNKENSNEFRANLFNTGFAVSTFIPFIIPILVVVQYFTQ